MSSNSDSLVVQRCAQALFESNYKQFLQQARLFPEKINLSAQEQPRELLNEIGIEKVLSHFLYFLEVWEESSLSREIGDKKRERQSIKSKGKIDKHDRRAIKKALLKLGPLFLEKADASSAEVDTIKFSSVEALIFAVTKEINALENSKPNSNLVEKSQEAIKREIGNIQHAISSFDTPTKKKKTLKYLGIFIAWIASLAAGISTGGAVYLLFPTLLIPAIVVGVFIFAVGYVANFRFFSQNLPNFLLSLVKKGGATEFINQEGKREQFSRIKKYLLLPLALLASLTVGISGAALTYTAILGFVSSVLPMLAVLWPPLPIVIVAILAFSVLVVLSVSTFNAIIEMLKKPLPSLGDLKQAFSIEKIRQLGARQIFSCIMHALLIPVALFGLVYFRITAGVDLSTLTGLVSAIVTGVAAFIAQIAFTVLSIDKLNKALVRPFAASSTQTDNLVARSQSRFSRIKSSLSWIYAPVALVSNAVGNAALVYNGSPLSTAGAVACGLNSLAGNIPEQDVNQIKRAEVTIAIVNKLLEPDLINNPAIVKNLRAPQDGQSKDAKNEEVAYSNGGTASFFSPPSHPKDSKTDQDKDILDVVINGRTWGILTRPIRYTS